MSGETGLSLRAIDRLGKYLGLVIESKWSREWQFKEKTLAGVPSERNFDFADQEQVTKWEGMQDGPNRYPSAPVLRFFVKSAKRYLVALYDILCHNLGYERHNRLKSLKLRISLGGKGY